MSQHFAPFHNRKHPSFHSHGKLVNFFSFVCQSLMRIQPSPSFLPGFFPREPTCCLLDTILRVVRYARANSCSHHTRKILIGLTKCVVDLTPSKDRTSITNKCKILE